MKSLTRVATSWVAGLGMLCAGLLLGGCASNGPDRSYIDPTVTGTDISGEGKTGVTPPGRLRIGDTVKVTFSGLETVIPPHTEKIDEGGNITLPYIRSVQAAGKTFSELANDIRGLYVPKYYNFMNVTVEAEDRFFVVGGDVRRPGSLLYLGPTTVLKAIESAGGFTEFAGRTRVKVTRANDEQIEIDCDEALADPSKDIPVYPGDRVHVPRRGIFR